MPKQNNNAEMDLVGAEFARTPEEEAQARAEIEADLATLRRGEISQKGLFDTIHNFGEERFTDALPEIKKYIISTDEQLRLSVEPFNLAQEVDWNFVNSYR